MLSIQHMKVYIYHYLDKNIKYVIPLQMPDSCTLKITNYSNQEHGHSGELGEKMSTFRETWGHGSLGQKQELRCMEQRKGMSMIQRQDIQQS